MEHNSKSSPLAFFIFCLGTQVFMSYDGGATPASIDQIVQETQMRWTEAELGLLGSLDKLAMTASSLLWGWALQRAPAKVLVATGLAINAVSTLVFGSIQSKEIMYLSKSTMGITQGLHAVWCTCWVLTHAPDANRTVWLGLLAVAAGFGNGLGTAIAGFGTSQGLHYAFAWQVEAACLAAIWILMLGFPSEVLALDKQRDSNGGSSVPTEQTLNEPQESRTLVMGSRAVTAGSALCDWGKISEELRDAFVAVESGARMQLRRSMSVGEGCSALRHYRMQNVEAAFQRGSSAVFDRRRYSTVVDSSVSVVLVESNIRQQLIALAMNPVYVWTALSLSACLFTMSGIQFMWVRLFTDVWGLGKGIAVSSFLIVTGIGGAIGTSLGPKAIDSLGGFSDDRGRVKSIKFITSMHMAASCAAVPCAVSLFVALRAMGGSEAGPEVPVPRGLLFVVWFCLWVVFAAGNATLAGLTGINVSTVDEHMMSLGSGCTLSLQNLLGFAMGPLLPGAIMDTVFAACSHKVQLSCGFAVVLTGCMMAQICARTALADMTRRKDVRDRTVLWQGNARIVPLRTHSPRENTKAGNGTI